MQRRLATHIFPFAMATLALLVSAIELAPQATGQTGDGWTTLCSTTRPWAIGTRSARATGATRTARWLPTRRPVRTQPISSARPLIRIFSFTSNSGRATMPTAASSCAARTPASSRIGPAMRSDIFDQRKDPTYGTGGIVNFSEVNPMPKAGGKVEHLRDHRQRPANHGPHERPEDGRIAQRPVRRRAVGPAARGRCDQVSQGGDQAALAETEAAASPPNGNHTEDAAASVRQRAPGATGCFARQRAARQRPTASPPDIVQERSVGVCVGGRNRTEPPSEPHWPALIPASRIKLGPALHVAPDQRLGLGRRQGEQPAAGLGK